MPKFEITVQGVTKLLEGLNGDQSLQTGKLRDDWVEANVARVFKKGDRHSPANYRPISLTCVCVKLLEHIICKQIPIFRKTKF